MVESLKLQKLDSVIFYANWKNHYFSLTEKQIGPVSISKSLRIKNNYLLILSALVLIPSLLIINLYSESFKICLYRVPCS